MDTPLVLEVAVGQVQVLHPQVILHHKQKAKYLHLYDIKTRLISTAEMHIKREKDKQDNRLMVT